MQPHRHGQPKLGFLFPGDLGHLQPPVCGFIEDRAAEKEAKRHFPFLQGVEILTRRQREVLATWHREIDGSGLRKGSDHNTGMRPQQRTHRLSPARGNIKQIQQLLLLSSVVAAPGRLDQHLSAQEG